MPLDASRTVAELRELQELTGDENGSQRVAWTDTWERARQWLREKVVPMGADEEIDDAGNQWFTLPGRSDSALLIGGHIDSVPNGGWLDGCLNVLAGVEILRRIHAQYAGQLPITVRLVDWADEEGARFGKSLFGSSACSGNLDMNEARGLKDKDGIALPGALKDAGVDYREIEQAYALVHQVAHVLANHEDEKGQEVLQTMREQQASLGTLSRAIGMFLKVTQSYWPGLFHCYDVADLPRTDNELEHCFSSVRYGERRASGRRGAIAGPRARQATAAHT